MSTPGGSNGNEAAILALLLLFGARIIDHIAPKGWHLKIIRFWAEPNETKDETNDEINDDEQVD